VLILPLLLQLQAPALDPLAVVVDDIRANHDMLEYHIAVSIPDTGTHIIGATTLRAMVGAERGPLVLDFDAVFTIDSIVPAGGPAMRGEVLNGRLTVPILGREGDTIEVTVYYQGSPADGLFIQENVHGERAAFADNWPDRAHHWFPSEDHPSDKAYATFSVEVPAGWKAIANGSLQVVDHLPSGRTRWHWRTERKIPVYTMVIGAGPFTVTSVAAAGGPDHTLWTFPQDSAFAADGPFRRVDRIVSEYTRIIGPFPYGKLAHVESSTRFGGMENSSAIFYTERGYADRRMGEGLVAHETAHQWFGDAVTEYDWHHLWLSEGFASYFGPLFHELIGEDSVFHARLRGAKAGYFRSEVVDRPVIDTAVTDLFELLNANNYPKAAWILHMLRGEVGDWAFFGGVRDYFATFRDSTALTLDFMRVMERHADRPLRWFFAQWLLQPGYPEVASTWAYDSAAQAVEVELTQVQQPAWGTYRIDVRVEVLVEGEGEGEGEGNRPVRGTARFNGRSRTASVRLEQVGSPPTAVVVDPNGDLLLGVRQGSE
jgi:aminopeptidase N